MLAMMIQPWSIALLVVVAASLGALSCFLGGMKYRGDLAVRGASQPSALDSPLATLSATAGRGWVLLGLSCLLRAGVVMMEAFLGQAQLPPLTFKIVSSVLSFSLAGATLLFCGGVYILAQGAGEAWRVSRQTLDQNSPGKLPDANIEYSNDGAYDQFDDDLADDETLHGDEPDRHLAGFLLVIDALIICASLVAVRWWLLVQPRLDQTAFAPASDAPLPALGALFHSLAVTGGLFAVVWLLLTFGLWKNVLAHASSSAQKWARASWETLLLGASLYLFANGRVFHHIAPPNGFDLLLQTLAPLCVGAAAWFARCSTRDEVSLSRVAHRTLAVVSAPREFLQRVHRRRRRRARVGTQQAFSWREAARTLRRGFLRIFWQSPSVEKASDDDAISPALEKKPSWRARFLQWRDALTLYVPCLALGAFALRMSWWAFSFAGATSSTRSTTQVLPSLANASATALHSWWLVVLFVAVGVRHLFFYRREQLTTRRLQSDVSQLSREVATRTRQLLSLHTVGAGLTNTLNRDQIVGAALERMMEAVRAEAGAVWLRADFDRELSRDSERRETPRTSPFAAPEDETFNASYAAVDDEPTLDIEYSQGAYIGRVSGEVSDATASRSTGARPHPNDWRLVRSQGFESAAQKAGLEIMNASLQRGGLPLCARECSLRKTEVGEFYLAPLHLDGEVAGILGVTRQRKSFEPVERRIMDAIGTEVAVALRNAQLYQEAHRRAERDSLTELLNHRTIQEKFGNELGHARKQNEELTLVMMDLNNFKFFNDTYGHPTGDGVLKTVARCLRETCRAGDIVGRYGGDEFIAVLPRTGAAAALKLCRAIEDRIERESFDTHDKDDRHIPINLSFGAAVFPHDGQHTLELLSVADANLYEAKRGGSPIAGLSSSTENSELRQLKEVGVGQSFGVLDALVTAIDNKDHYTRRHSEDVTHWALLMAHELDFPFEQQRAVRISGLLHDVGKIAVPDSILRKPGRLNDDEFGILQQHPVFGALIVKDVPNLPDVLGGIRHHHERFDGKGYPDKLAGENIPLFGRLLAIPDCFSAMTTDRPYRKALTWAEAFTEIEAGSGTQFDPQMVDAFLEVMARIVSQKNQQEALTTNGSTPPNAAHSQISNAAAPNITTTNAATTNAATTNAATTNAATTSLAATRIALIGETVPSELSAYETPQDATPSGKKKPQRDASQFLSQRETRSPTNSDAGDAVAAKSSPTDEGVSERALKDATEETPFAQHNTDDVHEIAVDTLPTALDTATNTATTQISTTEMSTEVVLPTHSPLSSPRLRHTPRNSLTSLKDSDIFADE